MKNLIILLAIAITQTSHAQAPFMIIHCNQGCSKVSKEKTWPSYYEYSDASFLIFMDSSNSLTRIEATFGKDNKNHEMFYIHNSGKEEGADGFSVYIYVHTKDQSPSGKNEYIKITDGQKNTTLELVGYGTEDWKYTADLVNQ